MRKKLKAVLFDMDGVLFNSMPYHSEAWHQVMKTHGLEPGRSIYARRTHGGIDYQDRIST